MASVKHLSGTTLAKWWLGDHAIGLGFVFVIVLVVVLGVVLMPMGPVDHVIGRIEGFSTKESEFGSFPVAVVDLSSTTVAVQLPRSTGCKIGDAVRLQRRHLVHGMSYVADWLPCPLR